VIKYSYRFKSRIRSIMSDETFCSDILDYLVRSLTAKGLRVQSGRALTLVKQKHLWSARCTTPLTIESAFHTGFLRCVGTRTFHLLRISGFLGFAEITAHARAIVI